MREQTRDLHRALEADVDPQRLFASVEAYADFVARLHRFHTAAEAQLAAAAALIPDLPPTPPRVARLAADLRALALAGVLPTAAAVDPVHPAAGADPIGSRRRDPIDVGLAAPLDADRAAGVVYVIEGSALGGAVLARMAAKRLGLGPTTGTAYFTGEQDVGPRWRQVAAAIDRHDPAGVVAGAVATFDAMRAVLVDETAPAAAT